MTDIDVKLNAWEQNFVQVIAVQGESEGRTINATLIDRTGQTDGTFNAESVDRPIDLTGVTARLYCIKPDGTATFSDGTITDAENGVASFVLPYQATAAAGDVKCQILLTKSDNSTLKTIGLTLNVQESNLDEATESSDEFSAIVSALNRVEPAVSGAEQAVTNANTAIDNINDKNQEMTAAESSRVAAESGRVSAENTRKSNEDARKSAETDRAAAESARSSAESTRESQESSRADAESDRASSESARVTAENTRKTNEDARKTAETARASAESSRKTAETGRVSAESDRADAESARASAESTRQSNEQTRQTQESGRVSAENSRATAENQRQTNTQTAISNAEAATTNANTAADRANTAAQTAEDAIAGQLDPAIDSRIAVQKNQPNGIAGLDSNGKVAPAQLPEMDYVPNSEKGAANGVATLNADKYLAQYVGAGRKSGTPIGTSSTAEGGSTTASGDFSHAEGSNTKAEGNYSHAEGFETTASGDYSHAEGGYATADGIYSHAEGGGATASGSYSHAEGSNTKAEGRDSHAEGSYATASGDYSHAEGGSTTASGDFSHAEGDHATAEVYGSHAQGLYNKQLNGNATAFSAASDAMVIGNGVSVRSNCFRVTFDGKVYGLSAFNSSGADYSEFFEWADENPSAEDRVGHFVTLDGEKIKLANDGDYIVGITSGNPAVIGDHPSESWNSRYLRDVFGRLQYEDVVIPAHEEKDKNGNVIRTVPEHTETHFKVNPDYDPAKEAEYANREKRPEWATVGLMGKLVVIDDGTCEVNGYCKPMNGTATKSDTGYRVLARLDETHIKVLMK